MGNETECLGRVVAELEDEDGKYLSVYDRDAWEGRARYASCM